MRMPNPELSMYVTFAKSSTTLLLCESRGLTVVLSNSLVSDVILPVQWTIVSVGVVSMVRSSWVGPGFMLIDRFLAALGMALSVQAAVSTQPEEANFETLLHVLHSQQCAVIAS